MPKASTGMVHRVWSIRPTTGVEFTYDPDCRLDSKRSSEINFDQYKTKAYSSEMEKLQIHVAYPLKIIFAYTSCIWMVWFHFIVSFLITQVIYQSFKILNDYFKIEFVSRVRKVSSKDWKVSNFLLQKVLVEAFQSLLLLSHRNEIWSCPTFLSV